MVEEQGVIVALDGSRAWVETRRQSVCGGCSANKSCGTGVLARYLDGRVAKVRALNPPAAVVGDTVTVGLHEGALLAMSALMYLLPLALLLAGALVAEFLARRLEVSSEPLAIAGGVAGLLSGFLLARRASRRVEHDARFQPIVIRVHKGL